MNVVTDRSRARPGGAAWWPCWRWPPSCRPPSSCRVATSCGHHGRAGGAGSGGRRTGEHRHRPRRHAAPVGAACAGHGHGPARHEGPPDRPPAVHRRPARPDVRDRGDRRGGGVRHQRRRAGPAGVEHEAGGGGGRPRTARRRLPLHDGGEAGGRRATLYLVGSGDPVLSSQAYLDAAAAAAAHNSASGSLSEPPVDIHTPVEQLADAVVAAGVTQVPAVVADDSRYDGERFVPSWPASYAAGLEAGPLGALMIDDAFATFTPKFTLAADPGKQAAVEFADPAPPAGRDGRCHPPGSGAGGRRRRRLDPVAAAQRRGDGDDGDERQQHRRDGRQGKPGFDDAGVGGREAGLAVIDRSLMGWGSTPPRSCSPTAPGSAPTTA